jgi:hypothetical protein
MSNANKIITTFNSEYFSRNRYYLSIKKQFQTQIVALIFERKDKKSHLVVILAQIVFFINSIVQS